MDIGTTLRALIKERNMRPMAVAKQAGISTAYMSQLLNYLNKSPSAKILDKIAKVIGVTVDDILHPEANTCALLDEACFMSCIRCGIGNNLVMTAHRGEAGRMHGWVFACRSCAAKVSSATIAITYINKS